MEGEADGGLLSFLALREQAAGIWECRNFHL